MFPCILDRFNLAFYTTVAESARYDNSVYILKYFVEIDISRFQRFRPDAL